ncbi:MAG: NADH-dependent flavin oxidoreductase [Proteobacteria bacterium]|nr:NADH-dependent flavin oxidoreductase [Pseudomonadota bacterium]
MKDTTLFSPFKLKHVELKNRIGVAPMTRMSSQHDSIPRKDVLDFLVRRAQNGAALIYTEAIVTDYESAQGYPNQSRLTTKRQIEAWQPIVKSIQKQGAKIICQLFHCGRMAWPEVNPANRSIAPSAITPKQMNPLTGSPYPVPDVMSQFDIDHVINGFVETSKGVIAAGFDGVEIHCAHGYLISQFLSSYSNNRTDGYGGSVKNRYRFAHEVIQAVRQVIPEDRLLIARISNWGIADMDVFLFEKKEDYQEVIRLFSDEPIDAISVSTYDYKEKAFGTDKNMAQLTREMTTLPIMICGKIYDRKSADDALKDADIILSAKSMLLNPNWVQDLRDDKPVSLYKSEDANVAYTDQVLL